MRIYVFNYSTPHLCVCPGVCVCVCGCHAKMPACISVSGCTAAASAASAAARIAYGCTCASSTLSLSTTLSSFAFRLLCPLRCPSPGCLPVRAIEISTGAKVIQFNASPGDGQAAQAARESPLHILTQPAGRDKTQAGRGGCSRGAGHGGAATGIAFKKLLS